MPSSNLFTIIIYELSKICFLLRRIRLTKKSREWLCKKTTNTGQLSKETQAMIKNEILPIWKIAKKIANVINHWICDRKKI